MSASLRKAALLGTSWLVGFVPRSRPVTSSVPSERRLDRTLSTRAVSAGSANRPTRVICDARGNFQNQLRHRSGTDRDRIMLLPMHICTFWCRCAARIMSWADRARRRFPF